MKYYLNLIIALTMICNFVTQGQTSGLTKDPVDYVDPFIGTDSFGHTFPGASLPYAMVHLSTDINTQGWTYCAGYIYSESSIMGFSHTHWSGVGMVNGGEVLIMPVLPGKRRKGSDTKQKLGEQTR